MASSRPRSRLPARPRAALASIRNVRVDGISFTVHPWARGSHPIVSCGQDEARGTRRKHARRTQGSSTAPSSAVGAASPASGEHRSRVAGTRRRSFHRSAWNVSSACFTIQVASKCLGHCRGRRRRRRRPPNCSRLGVAAPEHVMCAKERRRSALDAVLAPPENPTARGRERERGRRRRRDPWKLLKSERCFRVVELNCSLPPRPRRSAIRSYREPPPPVCEGGSRPAD